ncbi:hypothetical protein RU97_GL000326 [Enterococcus canis]|uniref:Uncharacterized protein n=1 Tax=Enterococcus canis TaxID=214095 RepID=A0A1L8RK02_9ENTE|nr:hypothetical protein RU97_GL000326 [Enterococcus canis]
MSFNIFAKMSNFHENVLKFLDDGGKIAHGYFASVEELGNSLKKLSLKRKRGDTMWKKSR